jgi:hypothetical protein
MGARQTIFRGAWFSALYAALVAGCSNQPAIGPEGAVSESTANKVRDDELHNGIRYVRLMEEYEYDKAAEKALSSLNSWLASTADTQQYKIDPMRERLPKELQPVFPMDGLAANKFRMDDYSTLRQWLPASSAQSPIAAGVRSGDFRYLHETHQLRRIADWAIKQSSDEQTEAWITEQAKTLDEKSSRKLRDVMRIFDWTIRHVQIEPAAPEPARAASGPTAEGAAGNANMPPALEGKPGPGYTHYPGHCLLLGRGDYVQRAWIFTLLARQAGCDVVLLAFENVQTSRPEPWACGAIIGDQIYLFDTRLGLPVPLDNDQGIATLAQVRENDALLRRLDLSTEMVYPANQDALKRLVALIEFSDASISKRMRLLESRLTGDEQMTLAVFPSEIAEAAKKAGVSQAYPWRIAYDAILFRASIDASLRNNPQFLSQYFAFEGPFIRPQPLALARYKHLNGEFEGDAENPGALAAYMNSRTANEAIMRFEESPEGRQLLAARMVNGREITPEEKQNIIAAQKNAWALAKLHASYFMGLAQYDRGAYPLAVEWFQKRTIESPQPGPWLIGAKYNLARSLEQEKKYRAAREIYLADQSPQKEGNLIRARRLKPLADAEPEAAAK